VFDAALGELGCVVLWLVQPDHVGYVEVLENLEVVFGRVGSSFHSGWTLHGTHEGDEFVRQDKVKVPVLYLLVVFIFFVVKLPEVVPSMGGSQL